jgi:hypothetical protein
MFTEARERGKDARPPGRMRRMPTNSIPTGYCGTLRPLTPQVEVKPLSGQEGLVDAIADVDIPDAEAARKLSIKVLPSTTPFVLFQYRAPIGSSREFDGGYHNHGQYGPVPSYVRCGVVTVQAFGPIGVVVVRLKPEAAPRFLGSGMGAFANVKVGLSDMLERGAVRLLEEKLAEARTSIERVTLVTDFLRANLRERDPDPLVSWAAEHLRHNPVRPLKCWAKASASSGLEKQNTTKSLSSRRKEYVSGATERVFANLRTAAPFLRPRTFSAASATWCGHSRCRSDRVISPSRRVIASPPAAC